MPEYGHIEQLKEPAEPEAPRAYHKEAREMVGDPTWAPPVPWEEVRAISHWVSALTRDALNARATFHRDPRPPRGWEYDRRTRIGYALPTVAKRDALDAISADVRRFALDAIWAIREAQYAAEGATCSTLHDYFGPFIGREFAQAKMDRSPKQRCGLQYLVRRMRERGWFRRHYKNLGPRTMIAMARQLWETYDAYPVPDDLENRVRKSAPIVYPREALDVKVTPGRHFEVWVKGERSPAGPIPILLDKRTRQHLISGRFRIRQVVFDPVRLRKPVSALRAQKCGPGPVRDGIVYKVHLLVVPIVHKQPCVRPKDEGERRLIKKMFPLGRPVALQTLSIPLNQVNALKHALKKGIPMSVVEGKIALAVPEHLAFDFVPIGSPWAGPCVTYYDPAHDRVVQTTARLTEQRRVRMGCGGKFDPLRAYTPAQIRAMAWAIPLKAQNRWRRSLKKKDAAERERLRRLLGKRRWEQAYDAGDRFLMQRDAGGQPEALRRSSPNTVQEIAEHVLRPRPSRLPKLRGVDPADYSYGPGW